MAKIPEPGPIIHMGDFLLEDARFPAVYFLYFRGAVVYVGQSKTLKWRIENHLTERVKEFDGVAYIRCPVNRLMEIEGHYIKRLSPKYNDCGIAKKARERKTWSEARKPALDKGKPVVTVDASECILNRRDIGEFLMVSDKDAAEWQSEIADTSVLGLLHFVANHTREVRKAQEKFESL